MLWNVKVRDKCTDEESTLSISTPLTKDSDVKTFVEKMPTSHGGSHLGFEVISVTDAVKDAKAAADAAAQAKVA